MGIGDGERTVKKEPQIFTTLQMQDEPVPAGILDMLEDQELAESILRGYVRETLREFPTYSRRSLLNEVYGPVLLEECMAAATWMMLTEAPEFADMTVGEVLTKMNEIEGTIEEREQVIEQIEKKEHTVKKLGKLVQKTIDGLPEDDSLKGMEKADRLNELLDALAEMVKSGEEARKKLVDPDTPGLEFIQITKDLAKNFKKVVLDGAKSMAGDMQIAGWDEVFDYADDIIGSLQDVPFLGTAAGVAKDVSVVLKGGAKGFRWFVNKVKGGDKPPEALSNMVDQAAQRPDTKTKTAPFMNLFNIDDEYQAILEDELEVEFIKSFKEWLEGQSEEVMDTPLSQLMGDQEDSDWNIDRHLEDWIPQQSDTADHTVDLA